MVANLLVWRELGFSDIDNSLGSKINSVKKRLIFQKDDVENFLFYGVLGAVIGGRVGYMLFYGFDQIIENPFSVLRVWEGGLSFHGGLIGILFSFYMFCKKTNLSFLNFQIILL